jgi:hypothetical protein
MHKSPATEICCSCNAPAVVELYDKSSNTLGLYCTAHKPDFWPGRNPHLVIERSRMELGNCLSQALAMAPESNEHRSLQKEMCISQLLGHEGACRYYISALTGIDHFALWSDEFVDNITEWIITETNGAANSYRFDEYTVGFMSPLLKAACQKRFPIFDIELTKSDLAVGLKIRNPNWSDEQIAAAVPTTIKQLQRWSDYKILGTARFRNADEDEGVTLVSREQLHQQIKRLIADKSNPSNSG